MRGCPCAARRAGSRHATPLYACRSTHPPAVSPKPVEELAAKGARIAAKLADAVTGADVVVTMLPSTPHVRDVYEGTIFTSARPGTLLVDCSTIDPTYTRAVGAQAAARKLRFVDAPVSGGTGGAEAGTLTFMVGGAPADFEAVKGILQAMGKNIVHCGGVGESWSGRRMTALSR